MPSKHAHQTHGRGLYRITITPTWIRATAQVVASKVFLVLRTSDATQLNEEQ